MAKLQKKCRFRKMDILIRNSVKSFPKKITNFTTSLDTRGDCEHTME